MPHSAHSFVPRRELGRTGFKVTQLGLGDLAARSVALDRCVTTLRRGLDTGINLVDTAPGYEDGYSEEIVGAALQGRKRDGLFVIDKIDHLERDVGPQIDESLARLRLAHCDLFAFHSVSSVEAWNSLVRQGRFEQLRECIGQGKARFAGISSHHPDVLRAAIPSGLCDVVMFPVGPFVDRRYVEEALPLARQHGVGTVCFKTFGAGKLLGDTAGYGRPLEERPRGKFSSGGQEMTGSSVLPSLSVEECIHYTLSYDPDVALLGLSFPNEQDAAFTAAASFSPLPAAEIAAIRERAAQAIQGKGQCWWNP